MRSPLPKQQKLDFSAKQVSGGELKKLVRWYVVEEMLHLNTPRLALLLKCTSNKMSTGKTDCCFNIEAAGMLLAAAERN